MEDEEYRKLGFRCGVEIHQQLEGKKLFCSCPTIIRRDEPHFTIRRNLRASAGESGEFDEAAKFEQEKKKHFIYQGYLDTTCMIETDDEPPRPLNKKALSSALMLCKMFNAKIPEHIVFMRKVVVDGSNTSGFQRTALVGMNGHIEVNGKRIGIPTICLEEESCQAIERTKECDIYNISRLGIPLIEVATDPDIESARECHDVAAKIGMMLRSTGACKRGIGSIRQDVNVSIRGGERIEIKGFQDLRSIPKIIEYEVKRQLEELSSGKKVEGHVRKAEPDMTTSYLRPMPTAERMYPETDVPHITPDISNIPEVMTIEDRQKMYEKRYGLNPDFSSQAVRFEGLNDFSFEGYFDSYPEVENTYIINFVLNVPREIKKKHLIDINPLEYIDEVLDMLNRKQISASSVEEILVRKAKGESFDISDYSTLSDQEVEDEVIKIIECNKGAPFGALMGKCMAAFKGKVDGRIVSEKLKKHIS